MKRHLFFSKFPNLKEIWDFVCFPEILWHCENRTLSQKQKIAFFLIFWNIFSKPKNQVTSKNSTASNFSLNALKLFLRLLLCTPGKIFFLSLSVSRKIYDILKIGHLEKKLKMLFFSIFWQFSKCYKIPIKQTKWKSIFFWSVIRRRSRKFSWKFYRTKIEHNFSWNSSKKNSKNEYFINLLIGKTFWLKLRAKTDFFEKIDVTLLSEHG